MRLQGNGEVVVAPTVACNIVGGFSVGGSVANNCPITEGAVAIPDPFLGLMRTFVALEDIDRAGDALAQAERYGYAPDRRVAVQRDVRPTSEREFATSLAGQ